MINKMMCLVARKAVCLIAVLMGVSIYADADVFLASDKKCYICGEEVLCSAFSDESNSVAYLELRDADKVLSSSRLLMENGRGGGSLTVPSAIPTGTYTLLCYTASGASDSFVLTVFNTSSAARQEGVKVGKGEGPEERDGGLRDGEMRDGGMRDGEPKIFRAIADGLETGALEITRNGDEVKVRNVSGDRLSFCLSIVREDGLDAALDGNRGTAQAGTWNAQARTWNAQAGHRSVLATSLEGTSLESDGEIIRAHLVGPDAQKVSTEENVTAVISFPGVKTGIYTAKIAPDGSVTAQIEPVFGKRDIACLLYGESAGSECHLELDPKSYPGVIEKGPGMTIWPCFEKALLWRTNALIRSKFESADSVWTSLPLRRDHFFLPGEATIFVLDDYKRFPTMEEEFVEILKCVRRRRAEDGGGSGVGATGTGASGAGASGAGASGERASGADRAKEIQVLVDDAEIHDIAPVWGNALVMMDGVPVFDQSRIWRYDPALVREVEIYRKTYSLGHRVYAGVINFITYKGNAPAMAFNDNVRLYDFPACSYPLERRTPSTLYWHPLLELGGGEEMVVKVEADGGPEGVTNVAPEGFGVRIEAVVQKF